LFSTEYIIQIQAYRRCKKIGAITAVFFSADQELVGKFSEVTAEYSAAMLNNLPVEKAV
jgi:hypothetical protein